MTRVYHLRHLLTSNYHVPTSQVAVRLLLNVSRLIRSTVMPFLMSDTALALPPSKTIFHLVSDFTTRHALAHVKAAVTFQKSWYHI